MITAIVLAAGESTRMGAHKVLLPFANTTVIEHIVCELAASRAGHIIVVTGHNADDVEQALRDTRAVPVRNQDYKQGMLSSVRVGLRAAPSDTTAFLIALGDQPRISRSVIDQLIDAHQSGAITLPAHDGRRGHPILIDAAFRDEILTRFDDQGLRGLLHAHPGAVHEVTTLDPAVLSDMDSPSDYQRELRKLKLPRLGDVLPELAQQVQTTLRELNATDIADRIPELQIVSRCGCGDSFCSSFYAKGLGDLTWPENLGVVEIDTEGIVNLSRGRAHLAKFEVIDRPDILVKLNELTLDR